MALSPAKAHGYSFTLDASCVSQVHTGCNGWRVLLQPSRSVQAIHMRLIWCETGPCPCWWFRRFDTSTPKQMPLTQWSSVSVKISTFPMHQACGIGQQRAQNITNFTLNREHFLTVRTVCHLAQTTWHPPIPLQFSQQPETDNHHFLCKMSGSQCSTNKLVSFVSSSQRNLFHFLLKRSVPYSPVCKSRPCTRHTPTFALIF